MTEATHSPAPPTPPSRGQRPTRPELMLPAGTLAHLHTALDFGADAVYVGHPHYSLRERWRGFGPEAMAEGLAATRRQGKKFYVTCNLLPHHAQAHRFVADLTPLMALQPDGMVLADPGLIATALDCMDRGHWPRVPIHLSAQANTTNHASVRFWQRMGVSRVILSRELGLDEIDAIRQACPDIELEVLVHGSLCIAYSGRALLSGYFNRCGAPAPEAGTEQRLGTGFRFEQEQAQSEPSAAASACGGTARHPAADRVYLLEEAERPGQLMPIMEDEHGTYILNSQDLCAIDQVARLVAMGVDALKIEGRTKSRLYVARTAQAYRHAIDSALAGQAPDPARVAGLAGLSPRGYTTGFLERRPTHNALAEHLSPAAAPGELVGEVLALHPGGCTLNLQQPVAVGDTLELVHPQGDHRCRVVQVRAAHDPSTWVALDPAPPHGVGALVLRHQA